MDIRRLAGDERADLAAFLGTLTPEQWQAPTLCPGWRVRDVVARVISYDDQSLRSLAVLAARADPAEPDQRCGARATIPLAR